MKRLAEMEMQLRQGQANDALHQIRFHLGFKSVLFRTKIRINKSQKYKTRSWNEVLSIESTIQHHAQVYALARDAMIKLGADANILNRYQILKREHLKAKTFLIDPSMPGTKNAELAWFWHMDISKDTTQSNWMEDCTSCFAFPIY